MSDIDKAKSLMEEGWKARENLEFEKAEKLLNEAKEMFEKEGDWFNVTEAINHLAYTERLKAVQNNLKGIKLAKGSRKVALEHSTKQELLLRVLMSLSNSAGLFEQGLKYAQEALKYFDKPAPRADILAQLATFQLRTGKLEEAGKTIDEAEKLIEEGFGSEREPHRSIWKSKILYTKSLIIYNKGRLDKAKEYMQKAYDLAKSQNLKTRIDEINEMKELF